MSPPAQPLSQHSASKTTASRKLRFFNTDAFNRFRSSPRSSRSSGPQAVPRGNDGPPDESESEDVSPDESQDAEPQGPQPSTSSDPDGGQEQGHKEARGMARPVVSLTTRKGVEVQRDEIAATGRRPKNNIRNNERRVGDQKKGKSRVQPKPYERPAEKLGDKKAPQPTESSPSGLERFLQNINIWPARHE